MRYTLFSQERVITAILVVTLVFIFSSPGIYGQSQQNDKIIESVEVNWWQLPVFAVDRSGNPIVDLKAEDIEVRLNGRKIDDFIFYKREFQVQSAAPAQPGSVDTSPTRAARAKPPAPKTNAIFLLFDLALSSNSCASRSKAIAYNVIDTTAPGTQFIVLTIEPFRGLHYICGPTTDKKLLRENIEKKVKVKRNARLMDMDRFISSKASAGAAPGQGQKKYTAEDEELLKRSVSSYFTRKNASFFYSFESLYLIFNAIQDNKFVYLFSEGISKSHQTNVRGGASMYEFFIKKAAKLLGRSGAVLFIVNPMGVHDGSNLTAKGTIDDQSKYGSSPGDPQFSSELPTSGKNSLLLLAQQSGGKYLEGKRENIVQRLDNIHKAYYEISFPDIPSIKGETRDIKIIPKRKGLFVHSLRSMEKPKTYTAMTNLEKEILALNLVSNNSLFKGKVKFKHARVTAIGIKDNRLKYNVILPDEYVKQKLVLYKFSVKNESEVVKLVKEPLVPGKKKIAIDCGFAGKQKNHDIYPYFVLVHPSAHSAVVRVIGDRWLEPEPETYGRITGNIEKSLPQISRDQMQRILDGGAGYCRKLANSAFHFICKEKIVESRKSLVTKRGLRNRRTGPLLRRTKYDTKLVNPQLADKVKKYLFSYRLLKQDKKTLEERDWFDQQPPGDQAHINKNKVVRPTAFLSEKAVFAPMTMLAPERQSLYHFRFIKFDKKKGRTAAVIQAVPLNPGTNKTIYGTLWIDTEDFSIWKIKADPKSILGFHQLTEFSKKLGSRLHLSLETHFDILRGGLRFPTSVRFVEKYRGGREVSINHGSTGWERSRTEFTYSGYRFFSVQSSVTVQKE